MKSITFPCFDVVSVFTEMASEHSCTSFLWLQYRHVVLSTRRGRGRASHPSRRSQASHLESIQRRRSWSSEERRPYRAILERILAQFCIFVPDWRQASYHDLVWRLPKWHASCWCQPLHHILLVARSRQHTNIESSARLQLVTVR